MRAVVSLVVLVWFAAGAAAQSPPVRVAGTLDKVDGATLTITAKDGETSTVTMAENTAIYGVEKRTLADLKPGDFIASGGVKSADGQIRAVELRIFPQSLRGTGEGQRPWSGVKSDGVMTNATVSTITQSPAGGTVHVTYKDGQSDFSLAPDVPVLAYVDADRLLLKPGAAILIFAQKQADGSLTTKRVTAEKDGVKPPM